MRCLRCGGFMYIEKFYDLSGCLYMWKCVNCGDLIDRIVLENRNDPLKNINFDVLGRVIDNHRKY